MQNIKIRTLLFFYFIFSFFLQRKCSESEYILELLYEIHQICILYMQLCTYILCQQPAKSAYTITTTKFRASLILEMLVLPPTKVDDRPTINDNHINIFDQQIIQIYICVYNSQLTVFIYICVYLCMLICVQHHNHKTIRFTCIFCYLISLLVQVCMYIYRYIGVHICIYVCLHISLLHR